MRFIVHASIWDVIIIISLGAFVVLYFVVWACAAWQERKKAKK